MGGSNYIDLDAELAVIGAPIIRPESWQECAAIGIAADVFSSVKHGIVWEAEGRILAADLDLNIGTLASELQATGKLEAVGGLFTLHELIDKVITSSAADSHAIQVLNCAKMRATLIAMRCAVNDAEQGLTDIDEWITRVAADVSKAIERHTVGRGAVYVGDLSKPVVRELYGGKNPQSCTEIGIGGLALWNRILTVVAGRPGMGKSAFCLNVALNLAAKGKQVLYLSLEDSSESQIRRAIARQCDVPLWQVRHNQVAEHSKISNELTRFEALPLAICDEIMSAEKIDALAAAHKLQHGLDLLIVDHLGYIMGAGKEYELLSHSCRVMAAIAKQLDIPVLLAVQINREAAKRADHQPTLSDLHGSGRIEQDARAVWLLHRPEYYDGHKDNEKNCIEINIAKDSHAETRFFRVQCDLSKMRIATLENETAPIDYQEQPKPWYEKENN
jgi:replicative DNA helicase